MVFLKPCVQKMQIITSILRNIDNVCPIMLYGQCEYQVTNKINMKEHIHNNDSCDQCLYHAELNLELEILTHK